MAKQYGNVYTVWAANLPIVILSGFQTVKEGLVDHLEELSERPQTPFFATFGQRRGIILSNGHIRKQQRRFGLVTMRKLGLGKKGMENQIEEEARQLVEIFAREKGQPFDPSAAITNSVSNVICAVTFGHRFSLEDETFKKLIEALELTLNFAGSFSHALHEVVPWLMNHLPGPHKNAFDFSEMLVSLAKKEIEEHKEKSLHKPQDFIDFYLLQIEKSRKDLTSTYDEENLALCIQDFFMAGTETTAIALKWAILLLTNHPDIQDKVSKELKDAPSSLRYQDRKNLSYTNAVIHEIQRSKYILLAGFPRQSAKDVNIGGFLIPKGTLIFPDLRSVLLDPKQWETPEEFNPNHFLDTEGNFVPREAFLPFGAGNQVGLGSNLARIETFIFLTSLLRAFRFQLPEVKAFKENPVVGITTSPHPYKVCVVPRSRF
ncbi:cytochrome P450 2J6-like [Sceloporus undulatus]|uniref:cytochrome P450 2J6-like n=1 Tax=Sceloporus undulatus TaxID=8520 RepID=UPI001C4D76F2|nr:cytochrome P450 2J6-like [Sceloporus undulatus]